MILSFQVGSAMIDVRVDECRELSCRGDMTNGSWMSFQEMVRRSGQDGRAAEITERRLACRHCLPTKEDVEFYVKDEFLRNPELQRVGITHLGTQWQEAW